MISVRSKIRNIFIALFVGAWMISAFHLAKQHLMVNRVAPTAEKEIVTSASSSSNIDNYSVLITSVVGVIHYFYKK